MFTRLQEATSLRALVSAVENAVWGRNAELGHELEADHWYLVDVFPDQVIVRQGTRLLGVPYSFDGDGAVQFGEAVPVEAEYRPIAIQEASSAQPVDGDSTGLEYEVEIIHPGMSKNGLNYRAEVLASAIPQFEGMHAYYFDDDAAGHKPDQRLKQPRQMVGWIDQVAQRNDGVIVGHFHFLQGGTADVVRTQVHSAWKRGKTDLFGLSIDARGLIEERVVEGRKVREVASFGRVLSTDIVLHPAAGGRFSRLVESETAEPPIQERAMSTRTKKLLALLESRRPAALAGIDKTTATFGDLAEVATDEELQEAFTGEAPAAANADPLQEAQRPPAGNAAPAAPSRAELAETRLIVREHLQESRLPAETQARVRQRFEGRVATEAEIQEAIKSERDYLATISPARIQEAGGSREGAGISVGAERLDKLQAAFDRAMGVEPTDPALKSIKPLGFRGLYNEITLGMDPEVSGHLQASAITAMLQEAFDNTTLPRVVANTLYRRMAKDYREVDYGERRIVSMIGAATDFKTQEAVRIGYFSDLSTVNPESADYAEIAAYGNESATYAVGQRGNLVTITRKHILNDDVGAVAKVVGRLGRAARRTFAKFVWDFFRVNGNIYDGTAWFTVGHNNLLTVALTPANLTAARLKLFNQTELTSGEKLALEPYLLVVPIDLEETAIQINTSQLLPGSANNDANRWYRKFGQNNENIIVNPLLTDANDWGVFANPADVDTIEVKFLNGQEEPEIFLADSPTVGQMFLADKIQYKIRHEYGGAVTDFRGAVKSVVV